MSYTNSKIMINH